MADTPGFAHLVPGFDFLQTLVRNAGAALPPMGQWVAPTLDPHELEKRIGELKTVQFWLEQNARMMATTIQALEVQRMTLATLRNMNVQMSDLGEALTVRPPEPPAEPPPAAPKADLRADASPFSTAAAPADEPPADAAPEAAAEAAPAVDPMQWWGALTRQFTQLAANAMKEGAARNFGAPGLPEGTPVESAPAPRTARKKAPAAAPRKTTRTKKPAAGGTP